MSRKRWTIAFSPNGEGNYRVEVRRSGAVHRFDTPLPPDISDLWEEPAEQTATTRSFRSGDAAALSPEERFFQAADLPTLKDIGERVLDCLFDMKNGTEGPKILGALEDRIADSEGVELEIDLSQTAELSGIPWESLYLRSRDRFLAIGTSSNIVRKLDAQAELPPPIERPIRILVAAANPKDDLETGTELGNIQRRIDELVAEGDHEFEIASLPDAKRDEFRRKVNDWQPHIIHYIGHSSFKGDEGYLYFESDTEGKSDRVSAETLRNMLLNRRPWLVVLNSCQSGATSRDAPMAGVAQNLLQRLNIPFVVAMQQPVSDEAAINFSQDFYTALTSGETVASAVTMGRCAIANDADELTQCELITPVLYTSGDADRLQFVEVPEIAAAAVPAAAAVAAAEDKPSFLQRFDTNAALVKSIIGSLAVIGATALGVWNWVIDKDEDAPEPQVVASAPATPAPVATEQPAIDDGRADSLEESELPVLASGPEIRAEQRPSIPSDTVQGEAPSAPRAMPVRRRVLVQGGGAQHVQPDGTIDTWTDAQPMVVGGVIGGVIGTAAPPPPYQRGGPVVVGGGGGFGLAFEQPGAPAPATELGDRYSPLGEAVRGDVVLPPDYPDVFRSMVDVQRFPVICDGKAMTVHYDLGATIPVEADYDRLKGFAQQLGCPRSKLVVAGFTDTTGSEALNIDISMARAMNVIEEMQPYGDMFVWRDANAYAENYQVVETADNVAEQANRRSEIYLDFYCPAQSEIARTLLPGQDYVEGQGARPYPGTDERPQPVVVALQQSDLSQVPPREEMMWLMQTARAVEQDIGAPPGMVFPMVVGGSCLSEGQDSRIDVIYSEPVATTPAG